METAANGTLRHRLTAIAGAVAAFTIATVIFVYLFTAYAYEFEHVKGRAEFAAAEVSKLVYARPDTWMFQEKRLSELITSIAPVSTLETHSLYLRVVDAHGGEVVELGTPPGFPSVAAQSPITDGFAVVGRVELIESAVHIWLGAIPVSLAGIALAWGIFVVLRVLPMRALLRREAALETARAETRASEQLLRLVTDAMPVLIGYVDSQQRIRMINNIGAEWYAKPRAEILGRTLSETLPAEFCEAVQPRIAAVLSGELVRFEGVSTYPDGNSRRVRGQYTPDFEPDGSVKGYYALVEDVTAQRETEEQLRQVQKTDALGQLTGGVAHDFNNLLGIILGNLEMLRDRQTGDPQSLGLVDSALKATLRGGELTQRLLAFSRKQALAPKVVSVNDLTANTVELLRRTIASSIRIETNLAPDLWSAVVDPGQLENAIVNLSINARDAMPAGGTLTIETDNVDIEADQIEELAGLESGRYVRIAVADTGTGMRPDVRERVFEPFFTTKEVGKGSGLGLSMVYGFVKQTGGHVKVYSEVGVGTTIRLYLPVAQPDRVVDAIAGIADGDLPLGRGETVLVVEDSEALRRVTVGHLEALGYAVQSANDGKSALAMLARHPDIALLFTDVILPNGMHGGELARQAQARRPTLKVVFASGYSRNAIAQQGRLAADVHYLNKPFRKQDLARSVRAALDDVQVAKRTA